MLKVYKAPNGTTWQYEEGKAPPGYVEAKPAATRDKSRTARSKRATTRAAPANGKA